MGGRLAVHCYYGKKLLRYMKFSVTFGNQYYYINYWDDIKLSRYTKISDQDENQDIGSSGIHPKPDRQLSWRFHQPVPTQRQWLFVLSWIHRLRPANR